MDALTSLHSLQNQATQQSRESMKVSRRETSKTALFQEEMQKLQSERAQKNVMRKEMDAVLSDVLNVLKKNGEQLRQNG